jgi:hypothetical protein
MKTGFIGNLLSAEFLSHVIEGFQKTENTVSGQYCSSHAQNSDEITPYKNVDSLISDSDLLYITKDDLPLFEISKMAVKEAKSLYFSSPFLLKPDEIKYLFHLARESKSVIRFNQKLLRHPGYLDIHSRLSPALITFRIDSGNTYNHLNKLRDILFDISSMIWQSVHKTFKKMYCYPVGVNSNPLPGACLFALEFYNGSHASILVNYLTEEEHIQAEFIQNSQRYSIDFTNKELTVFEKTQETPSSGFNKKLTGGSNLTVDDFLHFTGQLSENNLPLTINDDNQSIYSMSNALINKLNFEAKLPA